MPYAVYKLVHFLGIFIVLTAMSATCMHVLRGGTRADNPHRRALGIAHGIAAFLILLGGFGMLARLGIVQGGLPGWVLAKLAIWGLVSAAIMLPYRRAGSAGVLLTALPLLAVIAGAVALYKPF
jgi:hypothetical protein